MRTVLKTKQNKTVKGGYFLKNINVTRGQKKKSLQKYSRLKEAKDTRHQRKIPIINKESAAKDIIISSNNNET